MNHKQILDKYIVESTNLKIVESNLNLIADRFIKLNEDAIRENRVDELVPLLAAPLWAAAKFAGGHLLRQGASRLAAGALKRGASRLGQRALSGMKKGWSMLRGKTGRGVGKEVAADTAADTGVQSMMPAAKNQPNYLADLVASDKSGRRKQDDDEMVESFLFEALENIFEERKPGLFRRMISGAGRLGKGILGGLASGFMKGAFGAEPSEKGGFLSRVAKNKEALDRVKRIRQIRQDRKRAERVRAEDVKFDKQQRAEKEKQRVAQGLAAQAAAAPTPTATPSPTPNQDSVAAKRMQRAARGRANAQRAATGNWVSDPLQLDKPKDSDFNPSLLPSNQSNLITPKKLPKSLPKSGKVTLPRRRATKKPNSEEQEFETIPLNQFGGGVSMPKQNSSLIVMGQKIVESMLARVDELEVNPHIDREEIRRMKAAGVSRGQRRRLTRYRVATKIADEKAKAAMGKNTRQSTLGSRSKGNKAYIERGGNAQNRKPPMSRAELNRAKGSGNEEAKASANQAAFDKLVRGLAAKGEGKKK